MRGRIIHSFSSSYILFISGEEPLVDFPYADFECTGDGERVKLAEDLLEPLDVTLLNGKLVKFGVAKPSACKDLGALKMGYFADT